MSKFNFGKRSEQNLVGVHADLVKVVHRALELTPLILCNHRWHSVTALNFLECQPECYKHTDITSSHKTTLDKEKPTNLDGCGLSGLTRSS